MLRILVIGAHPDDCEIKAGGVTALYRAAGHHVKFVSVTNGEAGHQFRQPAELAALRRTETESVAKLMGIEYEVLNNRDGRLQPTLEARFDNFQENVGGVITSRTGNRPRELVA